MIMHAAIICQMGEIGGGLLWKLQQTFGTITPGIF